MQKAEIWNFIRQWRFPGPVSTVVNCDKRSVPEIWFLHSMNDNCDLHRGFTTDVESRIARVSFALHEDASCSSFIQRPSTLSGRLEDSGYPWRSGKIKNLTKLLIMSRIMNDSHTTTDVAIRARVCLTLNLNDLGSHPDTVVVRITRQRLLSGPLRHTETRFWSSCITDTDVGN